jgi:hypothetical protein
LAATKLAEQQLAFRHDARIFTPHTTTSVNIVNDATNNALSMEANLITPPSASYPGATLSDSIVPPQPASEWFLMWLL